MENAEFIIIIFLYNVECHEIYEILDGYIKSRFVHLKRDILSVNIKPQKILFKYVLHVLRVSVNAVFRSQCFQPLPPQYMNM